MFAHAYIWFKRKWNMVKLNLSCGVSKFFAPKAKNFAPIQIFQHDNQLAWCKESWKLWSSICCSTPEPPLRSMISTCRKKLNACGGRRVWVCCKVAPATWMWANTLMGLKFKFGTCHSTSTLIRCQPLFAMTMRANTLVRLKFKFGTCHSTSTLIRCQPLFLPWRLTHWWDWNSNLKHAIRHQHS